MRPYLSLFLFGLAFLSGLIFSGLGLPLLFSLGPAAVLAAVLFILRVDGRIAVLAGLILLGASFYYYFDDYHYRLSISRVVGIGEIQGIVVSEPESFPDGWRFYLSTESGRVLVRTGPEEIYHYGDLLAAKGEIKPPPDNSYGRYLAKERIAGLMEQPALKLIGSDQGNPILAFFIGLKNKIESVYKNRLKSDQAALLGGITLGGEENLSPEFLDNLSLSGTRHLISVSGLHMAIVVMVILSVCRYFLRVRPAFVLTFILVGFFTALTGFSVPAVRSAAMAFLASWGKNSGRIYAPYNALILLATVFALFNPKILVFDIGFQLSFLAVVGIIYLSPVLARLLRFGVEPGFLGWKQGLLATLSAQLPTAPILINQFQNFSFTSLLANILVLGLIPYVIIGGFLLALFSLIFGPFAGPIAYFAGPLLDLVIFVINLGGRLAIRFNPEIGFGGLAVYYGLLVFLIYKFSRSD